MEKHYLNLSNGILALEEEEYGLMNNYSFIRIQSTACEQGNLASIIDTISDDLLMNTALGHNIHLYDFGSRTPIPRAFWMGVEWLKYVLHKIWFHTTYTPVNRRGKLDTSLGSYFELKFRELSDSSRNRIKYYRKWLNTDTINISTHAKQTKLESQYDYMKTILTRTQECGIVEVTKQGVM